MDCWLREGRGADWPQHRDLSTSRKLKNLPLWNANSLVNMRKEVPGYLCMLPVLSITHSGDPMFTIVDMLKSVHILYWKYELSCGLLALRSVIDPLVFCRYLSFSVFFSSLPLVLWIETWCLACIKYIDYRWHMSLARLLAHLVAWLVSFSIVLAEGEHLFWGNR